MQIPATTKPALWGAAVGCVCLSILAFSLDWVVTADKAERMARIQSQDAVVASLTPICVAQYEKQSGNQALLVSLEGKSSWTRGDFVQEQGWATMPGSDKPNSEVATACATALLQQLSKG